MLTDAVEDDAGSDAFRALLGGLRGMSWVLNIALAALLWTATAWSVASACSCMWVDPLQALAYSDNVFLGTVISREEPPPRYILYNGDSVQVISGGDMIRWRLVASQAWKGPPLSVVEIYSERSEVSCGFEFNIHETYLVYASSMESDWVTGRGWPEETEFPLLTTNLCSRTRSLDRADVDLSELGEPTWRAVSPATLVLHQNRPNPFNPLTEIGFDLPTLSRVGVRVFDAAGSLIRTILDKSMPAGLHVVTWDGRDARGSSVASGVYFYEVRAGASAKHRRMVLLR